MKQFAATIGAAATGLMLISATNVRAGVTQLVSPFQLSPGDTTLSSFGPIGDNATSPLTYAVGGNSLTFFDGIGPAPGTFEFDQAGNTYFFTAFPSGTNILFAAGFKGPAGPITLTFAHPITEIGFNAEEFTFGSYIMSVGVFGGGLSLGTFTASGNDPDQLSFEGLKASGGTVISTLVIFDNVDSNIGLGPITFGSPVAAPEPGSLGLLGTALLATGLLGFTSRRRAARYARRSTQT